MPHLKSVLESLLFITDRPIKKEELANITGSSLEEVEKNLKQLIDEYNENNERGMIILNQDNEIQMATRPENAPFLQKFIKGEIYSELTPASLETLSIIAYRGPIKQEELEQIRGVNCSIILRNLLIKGLIEGKELAGQKFYNLSLNFLRYLGIKNQTDLPAYQKFHQLPLQFDQR